jgi:hypothetical protein
VDATLDLARVRLRPGTPRATRGGLVVLKGEFSVDAGAPPFTAAAGITVRVRDAATLDEVATWTAGECRTLAAGRVLCRSAGGERISSWRAVSSHAGLHRFVVRLRRRDIAAPLQGGVTVTATQDVFDRTGSLESCRPAGTGLACP